MSDNSPGGFLSWHGLDSYPGCTAVTLLITRVLHQVVHDRTFTTIPEVGVAYIVALALLVLATSATGGGNVWDYVLCFINSVGVAVTVVGGSTLFGLTSPEPRQETIKAPPVERVTVTVQPPNSGAPSP